MSKADGTYKVAQETHITVISLRDGLEEIVSRNRIVVDPSLPDSMIQLSESAAAATAQLLRNRDLHT